MNVDFQLCEDYTEDAGYRCVHRDQCGLGDIITDGGGLIDIRYLGPSSGSKCFGPQYVCCRDSDYVPPTQPPITHHVDVNVMHQSKECSDYAGEGYACTPCHRCLDGKIISDETSEDGGGGGFEITRRANKCVIFPEGSKCPGANEVCCKNPSEATPPPQIAYTPKCGQRNIGGLQVTIRGFTNREAQIGEWPHMCAIMMANDPEVVGPRSSSRYPTVVGGASLIAPGIVVTAAHKVATYSQNPSDLIVRCGDWDLVQTNEPQEHQERTVSHIDIHPAFEKDNPKAYEDNWALLYMERNFELAEHIDTVCLPQPDKRFDGDICYATGWGKDHWEGEYQTILKEVQKPVVNDSQCEKAFRSLSRDFKLDDSILCAGGKGEDTCKGDGGGPLVCPHPDDPERYVLAGMVAAGFECNRDNIPGLYVDVAVGVCWIDWAITCKMSPLLGFDSYFRYGLECREWMENELNRLKKKSDDQSKRMLETFQACTVNWGNDDVYAFFG